MGCCASTPSHDDDDQETHTQDRAEGHQTTHDAIPESTTQTRHRRPRPHNLPLDQHYNEPIRPHIWSSKRRLWTRTDLDRERREFFETRVTGREEIWAALSSAITLMQSGDPVTAQGIIDAAGVTVPTGDLCEGCYDEQGMLYRLPQCIVSDPENIAGAASGSDGSVPEESDGKLATDGASGDELIAELDLERRRDEKGKTSERDLIRVLARLSERDGQDLMMRVGKSQRVGFLARKIHQEAGLANHQRVRIAYLGRMLKEHESLVDQGWQNGHVINALVVSRPSL
ncbi:hypothetical protein N7520_010087 [Penicillium odoratum]|uniref:uncharacterized protein n=1 Tax=Penicillium odoratum TaxID=1167516 RepID=UPI00254680EA|nr:uncharacterized protein N7520_010087 [Penicillium odoratum]KAJ5753170.1 hypothetical protein N7520_010087 [Penicillium odoratum]